MCLGSRLGVVTMCEEIEIGLFYIFILRSTAEDYVLRMDFKPANQTCVALLH